MYSTKNGLETVGVRIGNLKLDRPKPLDRPNQLSHDDCVRVFEQAITHPGVEWELVFGVSDSSVDRYDLEHGRRAIGCHPQDSSTVPEDE